MNIDLSLENKVIEIVKEAVLLVKNATFAVIKKENEENIVTSSDLLVQSFLIEKLTKLIPDSGLLCEENKLENINNEYVWVIDPIDGTTNYSRGIKDSAISVALVHNKEVVLGVVANIFIDEIFSATKGYKARLNNKEIKVSNRPFKDGILCTAMSLYRKDLAKLCNDVIYEAYLKCNDFRRFGSCALELCYLATGRCDLYFEIRVFPWDYLAAYLILKEAGGVLTGYDSKTLIYDETTPLIGANNLTNHNQLVEIVNKYIKQGDIDYGK